MLHHVLVLEAGHDDAMWQDMPLRIFELENKGPTSCQASSEGAARASQAKAPAFGTIVTPQWNAGEKRGWARFVSGPVPVCCTEDSVRSTRRLLSD